MWDKYEQNVIHFGAASMRKLKTAKPELDWKALIKTLSEVVT